MARADELRKEIMTRGIDASGTRYVSSYDSDDVDSTLLLLPSYGLVSPKDPLVTATRENVVRELGDRGFLHRYRSDDGVSGREGAFLLCGFWLAEALAQAGEVERAEEVFVRHAESSNQLGLLSEEIDPASGALLGNFPQGFSHMGLINAAARIDAAMRLRDEHSASAPRLATDL
jgi:GH15 family glucan-1,4-alpha-glucosidase